MERLSFKVPLESVGMRLDVFLAEKFPERSRSGLARWIKAKYVRINRGKMRAGQSLCAGDLIEVDVPEAPIAGVRPQAMDLTIRYEDEHVLVVEKPSGLVVHPGAGHPDGTLVNGLIHRYGKLSPVGAADRPGIVHRIDAGTTGLMVVARTEVAHHHLAAQFAAHTVERRYLALIWDHGLADEGVLETPYGRHPKDRRRYTSMPGGQSHAITHWRVLARRRRVALAEMQLETGRTHQIRVHLSEAGNALLGDQTYGRRRRIERPLSLRRLGPDLGLRRQALHAAVLGFEHPVSGKHLWFGSPLPEELQRVWDALCFSA